MNTKVRLEQAEQRESPVGTHFIGIWQGCKWKFYLRYVLGYMTKWTKSVFLYGTAIHSARAVWYNTGNSDATLNCFESQMEAAIDQYMDADKWRKDNEKGIDMLELWIETFGRGDLRYWDVLGTELAFTTRLPNGYIRTGRPDTVLRNKDTGRSIIIEAKTTGLPWHLMMSSVIQGDQVTDYLWHCRENHPEWKVDAVIADVMYASGKQRRCERSEYIMRSKQSIDDYVLSTQQELSEMSQKVLAVKEGHPPEHLFSRNTSECISHMSRCEYMDICRQENLLAGDPPYEFVSDPRLMLETDAPDPTGLIRMLEGEAVDI
jgi:hypothetical protein